MPSYYKNDYEKEYYHAFQVHGNRRIYKDHYKDKYRDKNFYDNDRSYDMDNSYSRDREYIRNMSYSRDKATPENTKETGHTLEICNIMHSSVIEWFVLTP